jgi:hypothetical protein
MVVNAGASFNFTTTMSDVTNGGSYFIAVPVGPSGIALLGETNKFVTRGKKRISGFSDTGLLRVAVAFAAGESNVTLCGYAPANPYAFAQAGATNNLTYDSVSHLFTVNFSPGNSGTATVGLSLAPMPSLQITPVVGGQFQISWPAAAAGYGLEMSINLAVPAIWDRVTNSVSSAGGQNTVTVPAPDPAAFYRLTQ